MFFYFGKDRALGMRPHGIVIQLSLPGLHDGFFDLPAFLIVSEFLKPLTGTKRGS
jgi:hypothetical protein